MKNYAVVFEARAQDEALEAAEYIARHSPKNAVKWYAGLEKAIDSLKVMYHSHRIIFQIEEKAGIVRILHA